MFRFIKIIFNAILLVLAFVGFNAIGGEKYTEAVRVNVGNFIQEQMRSDPSKVGDFSGLNEEFQVDKSVNLLGYKAVLAEHKNSNQKMCIVDSGKKPLLTSKDIQGDELDKKIKKLVKKFKYQGIGLTDVKITKHGYMDVYGQSVPFARFEAKVTKLPFTDISGIVASVKTEDGSEKLVVSINDKKKYSQLVSEEFFSEIKED